MNILLIDDKRLFENIPDPRPENRGKKFGEDPNDTIEVCTTGEDGVSALTLKEYGMLLLDNDLGYGMMGRKVLEFLEENTEYLPKQVYLVTMNVVEGARMLKILEKLHANGSIEQYGWIR